MCDEVDYVLSNAKYYNFIVQEDEFILHKLASTCPVTANQIRLPLRHLCDLGVNIDLLDLNGNTPLIKSCSSTVNVVLAKDLMQRGADVNLQNERGNTALHECILSSATDTALNLICRCFKNYSFNMSIRNIDGLSVIHLLTAHMFSERTNTFKTLLNATNDINLTDLKGNTVLHKIVMLSENDMNVSSRVADVLDTSDDVDTEIKGSNGRTVLNMACSYSKYSRFSTILLLLNYGADINSRDKFGNTPLYNVVKFLDGFDIITVFERFIRVLALLSLDCDLEGNRTDTPVQLSRTRQYNDVCAILTKYEISKAVTYLNDIVGKLLRRYQPRIHVAHLPSHKKLSKEIVNIINKAYSRIGHLRFDTDDDLELGSDYVDVNMSTALSSHRQSENFSTRVRESSSGANSFLEDCIDSKVNYSHNDVSSRSSESTRNTSPSHSGYGTLDNNTSTDDNYGQYESMIDDDQEEDNDDDD
ncbi:unnamed protein product [Mytilus edulis]|uniref:Uncharacterized protein n=1 Tax=Mytilus edulis TaxID=6550 RepID=A0A8S3V8Y6_MYTED|nr:unnamed protein product [Mytilus edulis]